MSTSEIDFYMQVGNFRPTPYTLREVIDKADAGRVHSLLSAADACIDMAMLDTERPATWIDRARDFCDETIKFVDWRLPGATKEYESIASASTAAHLRKAELSNWENAATGLPPENNYETLLEISEKVADYDFQAQDAYAMLLEFVPILLGSRALQQECPGWMGRLALGRENYRHSARTENITWSWDTVLIPPDATAEAFDIPSSPLQIKHKPERAGRKNGGPFSYARAGINTLYAARAGFDLPKRLIWGCIKESGGSVPDFVHGDIATNPDPPYVLDMVTQQIDAYVQQGEELIRHVREETLAESNS